MTDISIFVPRERSSSLMISTLGVSSSTLVTSREKRHWIRRQSRVPTFSMCIPRGMEKFATLFWKVIGAPSREKIRWIEMDET
jgi:hypothetical protein